jgi:deazaflavin-dependent oxidoreductase (nitroreductase family)
VSVTNRQDSLLRRTIHAFAPVHVGLYRTLRGRGVGRLSSGRMPVLLLTTTGRRSGQPRTVPVGFARDGDDLVVLGSHGGLPEEPAWVGNLRARPEAEVQIGPTRTRVIADWPTGAERQRLWDLVIRDYPMFVGYQRKISRQIPVIRLRPVEC